MMSCMLRVNNTMTRDDGMITLDHTKQELYKNIYRKHRG